MAGRGRILALVAVLAALLGAPTASADDGDELSPAEARASQWYLEDLGILEAQRVTTGEGVRVCVIDGGADAELPELDGIRFVEGMDLSGRGRPDGLGAVQQSGHGSTMAALIAGQGQDGEGILGVAPEVEVISVSDIFGLTGARGAESLRHIARGVVECVNRGAGVVSMSIGVGFGVSEDLDRALAYAQAHDAVLLAASGNGSRTSAIERPASRWGVVAVGGVLASGSPSEFFGTQRSTSGGVPSMALAGQGVAVLGPYATTADPSDRRSPCATSYAWVHPLGGYVEQCGGTSGATAVVAGVAALVRAAHPDLDAANVVNRLLVTASRPAEVSQVPDQVYGWGVVDAAAAVSAEVEPVDANPLGSLVTQSMGVWWPDGPPPLSAMPSDPATSTVDEVLAGPAPWAEFDRLSEEGALPGQGGQDSGQDEGEGMSVVMLALLLGGAAILLVLVVGGVLLARTGRRSSADPEALGD